MPMHHWLRAYCLNGGQLIAPHASSEQAKAPLCRSVQNAKSCATVRLYEGSACRHAYHSHAGVVARGQARGHARSVTGATTSTNAARPFCARLHGPERVNAMPFCLVACFVLG